MRVMAILATLLCALRSHDTYAKLRHHFVLRGQRGFFINPCFSENQVSVWHRSSIRRSTVQARAVQAQQDNTAVRALNALWAECERQSIPQQAEVIGLLRSPQR
jgi:acyl-CoA thioesterase